MRLIRHVHQHQLWLYRHVACYHEADPAHQVVSVRDNSEWRRPRGHPCSSWLQQVDSSSWEVLRMWRGPALRLARRDHWLGVVGWARRHAPQAYAPTNWLIDPVQFFAKPSTHTHSGTVLQCMLCCSTELTHSQVVDPHLCYLLPCLYLVMASKAMLCLLHCPEKERKSLSISEKLKVIELYETSTKTGDLMIPFDLKRSTLHDILWTKDRIREVVK